MGERLIWQVDDTPHWHHVTDATLAALDDPPAIEHFHSGQAALQAWDARCVSGGLPDLVLMDFYIGDARGDQLAMAMREREPADHRSLIAGHSSVIDCSERIRHCAGDVVIRKHAPDGERNPSLLRWLRDWLASDRPR